MNGMSEKEKDCVTKTVIANDLLLQLNGTKRQLDSVPSGVAWDDVRDMMARKIKVIEDIINSLLSPQE